ncbi:MAG TPA: PEP-CTERM sorting domain-containing protein [Tepidisphaeraceae bacterium]|jgi:hypothetical protein|nr:PEP-CTERM sorting domain-containing protein [Tepidisphaeraceae bacterium]
MNSGKYSGFISGNSDNQNGKIAAKTKTRRRALVSLFAAIAVVDCASRAGAATQTYDWAGGTSANWSNSANWNPSATYPNNGNDSITDFAVVINSVTTPNVEPNLDVNSTIDTLSLGTGATLDILGNSNLTINGPTLTDNGTILVNANQSYPSTLDLVTGTLSGSGAITLDDTGNGAILAGTFTQSSGHTINGYGEITASLTNNSTVNANLTSKDLNLLTNNMTNNSVMEATNGGILNIGAITITQGAAGSITAAANSTVDLTGSTINDGTLTSSGGGIIQTVSGDTSTIGSVTNNATLDVVANTTLAVTGNLTDNGLITVNNNQSYAATLTFSGGTVSGSGTITLDYSNNSAVLAGTLTQSLGHTINGYGQITASLTNNGTVNANVTSNDLYLLTNNMTNNSVMEATNSGILNIGAITITQGAAGSITAAANSTVDLTGSTINDGTLTSSGGGIIQTVSGDTSTIGSVTNNATLDVVANSNLAVTGNLTDNGLITVNNNQSYAATLTFSGGTVSGSGTITLDNTSNSAVLAGTLTQSLGHTINGYGEITASLTNNGIIDGNNAAGPIVINSTVTNGKTIEATGGGGIDITGATINNASGLILNNGGSVTIENGAAITGGTITADSPSVITLNTATLSGVTFSTNTTTDIAGNNVVTLIGTTLTNNGTIVVNTNQSYPSELLVNSKLLLTGTGTVTLDASGGAAFIATGANDTLTLDTHQTVNGLGTIEAVFTNNGTVNANVSGQAITLNTNNMTNNSVMESTGGGNLTIAGISVTQGSAGTISATGASGGMSPNPSVVDLNAATITGGTIASSGGGFFQTTNGTSTIGSLTSTATINVVANTDLDVTGNLVDNGLIVVNSNQSYSSVLTFSGGTLSGSGTITLDNSGASADLAGTLTQSLGHTINGYGEISAALTNNGTVNANVNGQSINLTTGPITNNSLIEATGTASLNIGSVTITQGTNGQISAAGGTVALTGGATITGGTLLSSSGGLFQNNDGASDTIGGLTNDATFNIRANGGLTISSNIVNNGAITVNSDESYPSTLTANGTITGTGGITLQPTSYLRFGKNVGGSSQSSLTINGGSSYMDLNNNHFYINYGTNPDPAATIRSYLTTGYAAGAWDGAGINSSAATANSAFALGYADSADPGNPAGLATDQIEVKYTLYGDTNLDGSVNSIDFGSLAANFGKSGKVWDQGDFNYDGTVNSIDFGLLAGNFGKSAGSNAAVVSAADWAALDAFAAANGLMADVPEPASMGLLILGAAGVLARRRRR